MFVRAEKDKGSSIVYYRNDGGKLVRTGGSSAWRNNNPGNIRSLGNFAKENGSIGEAKGFALFPDYETGRRALARLLRGEACLGRLVKVMGHSTIFSIINGNIRDEME